MPLSSFLSRTKSPSAIDYANQAAEVQQQQVMNQQKMAATELGMQSAQEELANKRRSMAISMLGGLADEPDPMKQSQLYATLKPMAERYDPTLKLPEQYDSSLTRVLTGGQIDPATRMQNEIRLQSIEYRRQEAEQREAEANETARQRAEEKNLAAADRGAKDYSQRVDQAGLAELLPAVNNTVDKLAPYSQPGADIPGFGEVEGLLPDFMTGQEGRDLRQAYSGVRNAILKARSGGAVTPSEADRLLQELGEGTLLPDDQVVKGIANVSIFLRDRIANLQAGFTPEAIGTYRDRGGNVTTEAVRQLQVPSAGPKVGVVEDGYVYLGGDPADPKSWKAAR